MTSFPAPCPLFIKSLGTSEVPSAWVFSERILLVPVYLHITGKLPFLHDSVSPVLRTGVASDSLSTLSSAPDMPSAKHNT